MPFLSNFEYTYVYDAPPVKRVSGISQHQESNIWIILYVLKVIYEYFNFSSLFTKQKAQIPLKVQEIF